MGSWGITMRQSDYGLDLLGSIIDTQLKKMAFATFNVPKAPEVMPDFVSWRNGKISGMRFMRRS